jgi:hypothetical protein
MVVVPDGNRKRHWSVEDTVPERTLSSAAPTAEVFGDSNQGPYVGTMDLARLVKVTNSRFHIVERWHACAILSQDFRLELTDIVEGLNHFELLRSEIQAGGGGKTKIANRFDKFFQSRGWKESKTSIKMIVGDRTVEMGTHKVDFCKSRVAVELEWNNKDPFFSRDLNAFRLLHDHDVISVGVLITRMDELQAIFDELKVGKKYGASTTHWGKLIPRVESGGGGTCPLLLIGITKQCFRDDVSA